MSKEQERRLGKILVRGFTKKQLAILESVSKDKFKSITSTSKRISEEKLIPLSTVKLGLKIFEQLDLVRMIEKEGFKKVSITKFGRIILRAILNYNQKVIKYTLLDKLLYLFSFNKIK
ncbi:MAG: hypothetical protein HYW24_01155 [Candidatus Aenigmarchaeota archaeon]|nr:hypothetical protein [Candidatus Aenigmarchaeota archaeon]